MVSENLITIPTILEGFVNKCPSERCWDYDVSSNRCSLKDKSLECSKLICGATTMSIEFSENLFGEQVRAFDLISDEYEGDYDYGLVCDLGTCEMRKNVIEDK